MTNCADICCRTLPEKDTTANKFRSKSRQHRPRPLDQLEADAPGIAQHQQFAADRGGRAVLRDFCAARQAFHGLAERVF